MVAFGALQSALWVGAFAPTWVTIVALVVASSYNLALSNDGWSLLVQTLLGLAATALLLRSGVFGDQLRPQLLAPVGGVEATAALDALLATLAALAYGFLYEHLRPTDPSIYVRESGALSAEVLVLAFVAVNRVAKQLWFRNRTPPDQAPLTAIVVEISAWTLCIDLLAWGSSAAVRIGAGSVLGTRIAIGALHYFASGWAL